MTKQNLETHAPEPPILEVNGVRLNLETREVVCDGMPVNVASIEFDILEILVRFAGQVIPAGELARALVDKQANPFEGSLDVPVNQLRSKLERGRRLIRTIQGAGYLFVAGDQHGASNYQLA